MSLAIIFNGQGAHYEGMGQDFVATFPEARAVYEKVETLTGYPIRQWSTENSEALAETRYAQTAIAGTSLAIYESIKNQLPAIRYMAGLSLGEYSALVASGMLGFEAGFKLLQERGELMTAQCQRLRASASIVMEAVMNMPLAEVQEVMAEVNQAKEQLYLANLNSSTQVILAGVAEAVAEFKAAARERGYRRMIPLKVEGPFHSPYMAPVCAPFREALEAVTFTEGDVPVISNTTVEQHTAENVPKLLVRHLVEPVRWQETMDYLTAHGVTKLIQIGPGKTLANLLKREPKAPEALVVDKVTDVEKIEGFLGGEQWQK